MNSANQEDLEQERLNYLKINNLDDEGVTKLRKHIEKVSEEEANRLGKELYDFISKKSYKEEISEIFEVQKLIQKGANLDYQTEKKGDTPLLLCARRGYEFAFGYLARYGADINKGNFYGTTPVMTSARHGNKEILKMLIALKADLNAQCLDGDTALMSAKRHDQKECFELLKQANAHFGIRNLQNQTVVDIPSSEQFDFNEFISFESFIDEDIKEESPQDLLKEAREKMTTIIGDFKALGALEEEKEKLDSKSKTKTFKRVK